MRREKAILSAIFISGSLWTGTEALFAQGSLGLAVRELGPEMPSQTQPGRGLSQSEPVPGQPGTIPERIQPPDVSGQQEMVISAEEIKRAQEALKAKGHDPGAVTGRMHARTQEALREFQKANNLTPTGVLDKKTADKLGVVVPVETGSMP
jgi:hypothetical protein